MPGMPYPSLRGVVAVMIVTNAACVVYTSDFQMSDTDASATSSASDPAGAASDLSGATSEDPSGTTADPSSATADPSSATSDPSSSTTALTSSGTGESSATTTGSSSDVTTATTGGDATGTTTGSLPECDGYMGQATPEQTAITPQGDDEAEQLALEASGEIVAPPALFDRIVGDLIEIRAAHPEVALIEARADEAYDRISIRFTEAGAAQIADKTYHAWDCPNALYDVEAIMGPKNDFVTLVFDGLYMLPLIYSDYLALDEVLKIFPISTLDGDDVCAALVGEDILYIFDHGYGDCPEGCTAHDYWGFTVDADANVTPLGTFSTMDGVMAPAWLMNAGACKQWL